MNETPDIMPVYELKTVQFIDFYEVTRGLSEDFEEQVDNAIDRNHTWGDASLTLISLAFVVDNCKADGIDGKELDELEKRIGLLVDAGIKYAAVENNL